MFEAFSVAPDAVIAHFGYTCIIGAKILGYILFEHIPVAMTALGATIIIASGLYILNRESRARRKEQRRAAARALGPETKNIP